MKPFAAASAFMAGKFKREPKVETPAPEMETAGKSAFFLTSAGAFIVLCAAITEWYWAIVFCIESVGRIHFDWDAAAGNTPASTAKALWDFSFSTNLPVLLGLLFATLPIVLWSMVWLPTWFAARGTGRWRRVTMCVAGLLCNFLIVVSGTVIMNGNRQEQVRESLVVEQTREEGVAALARQKETLKARLDAMTTEKMGSRFQAQAARAGEIGWAETIRQAEQQQDPLLPQIRRAMGSAKAADALQKQIDDLDAKIAAAPTRAAVAANVEDKDGAAMNHFATMVEVYRPPFVALVCTIIGIFGGWWLVGLYDKLAAGRQIIREQTADGTPWADEAHMVPDMREEEPVKSRGMAPAKERVVDGETGEELVKVTPREYWRRTKGKGKKGQPVPMEVDPVDAAPDDAPVLGAHDDRVARSGADERSGVEVGDDLRPEATDDVSVVGAAGPAIVDPDAADDVHLRRAAELGDDEPGPAAGVDGNGDADAGDQREDAAVNAASLYAFLSEPNPGRDQPRVVYDAPIGPQQPKGLGPEGKDGVILADVAAE